MISVKPLISPIPRVLLYQSDKSNVPFKILPIKHSKYMDRTNVLNLIMEFHKFKGEVVKTRSTIIYDEDFGIFHVYANQLMKQSLGSEYDSPIVIAAEISKRIKNLYYYYGDNEETKELLISFTEEGEIIK